jgi:flagellar motility protein MotE (MotC chaperone)
MILQELFEADKKSNGHDAATTQFGGSPDEQTKDSIFNYKGIFPDIKLLAIRAREEFPVATNDLEAILKYLNQHRIAGEREIDELERENDNQEKTIQVLRNTEKQFQVQLAQDEEFEQSLKAEIDRQHNTDEVLKQTVQTLLDKEKRFADYAKQMAKVAPENRDQTWHSMSQDVASGEMDTSQVQRHL